MSFQPVCRWVLRCDGTTTRGRCPRRWDAVDPTDQGDPDAGGGWSPVPFDRPRLDPDDRGWLAATGWLLLRDGRVLCPAHIAALEFLARAALDGLPLDEENPR